MVNRTHFVFKADDRSYFAILKKDIHALALQGNFNERKVGEIDIIVSEMISNFEGPGMIDVSRMVTDGVSTKNTLGQGLGAMKRLSDVFQVYSQKEWGTIILVRVYVHPIPLFTKLPGATIRSVL